MAHCLANSLCCLGGTYIGVLLSYHVRTEERRPGWPTRATTAGSGYLRSIVSSGACHGLVVGTSDSTFSKSSTEGGRQLGVQSSRRPKIPALTRAKERKMPRQSQEGTHLSRGEIIVWAFSLRWARNSLCSGLRTLCSGLSY
ncbi:hypothetical protein ASPZODRAFT_134535 [Penicilliopsis zonata CBS 506.65]|uniref:Uncharacterized protein n=1 Tax=Penicilliopsis zonata CBS 506.65 TaxID=1073090 RepID=A0A1L9SD56_9EURO|nr:hypothetical protein ASPZODRAFT_134535 [Penicilliopsis zonata CBS 506.65]OJJ45111.1 hypothetical protein ASPZODRAFT_134535 [Penicilliopsis zonata CBS 506.65]